MGSGWSAPQRKAALSHSVPTAEAETDPIVAAAATAAAKQRRGENYDELQGRWRANDGAVLESVLAVDSYLGSAPIRLLDARFLIRLAKMGGVLMRRQDVPEAAFLSLDWVKLMSHGYLPNDLRILCISYPWLQAHHPDGHGHHLQQLARVLEHFVNDPITGGMWAVFLE